MKYFLLINAFCLSLLPLTVQALNHQSEISRAQQWANTLERPYPIWIFDRDELNFIFVQRQVIGDEKKQERLMVIKDYVLEKTNTLLNNNELDNLDTYLSLMTDSAVALPLVTSFASASYKFCAVFPLPPNGNAEVETERLLQLQTTSAYTESYSQLTKKMSLEELYLFSLYHELGHCADPIYMPQALSSTDDSQAVHLSEAFAEVFAYMALANRLGEHIAVPRSLYRTIYSRRMGEFLAKDKSPGAALNPHRSRGGVIYYLTPYLMDAYEKVRFKKIKPQELSPQDLVTTIAHQIIDLNEIEHRSFTGIAMALLEDFEPTIEKYQENAFNSPEFFYTAYLQLLSYRDQTDAWLARAFLNPVTTAHQTQPPSLPLHDLCTAIQNNDLNLYLNSINQWRDQINTTDFYMPSLRTLYVQMNDIQNVLATECSK